MKNMRQMLKWCRRFSTDDRGVIAMEFTIWLPFLVLWIALSFLFFDAYRSNSKTEKVAYAISDIVSRYEFVNNAIISDLVTMQDKLLPGRVDQRSLRISSICYEDDTYKVMWSFSDADEGVTGIDPLEDATIPTAILPAMADQDSIILTELRGRWTPITSIGGLADITWVNQLVTRPRFVQIVPHEELNDETDCPIDAPSGT